MDAEIVLLHDGVRPGIGDQLVLSDHLARALDQCHEQIKSPPPEPHGTKILEKHLAVAKQLKRSENENLLAHG
jgi:hypothetical protein